jgi:hypothetical protein
MTHTIKIAGLVILLLIQVGLLMIKINIGGSTNLQYAGVGFSSALLLNAILDALGL